MEYKVDHLGVSMATMTPVVVKVAWRRYMVYLSLSAWRDYANLILDMTKYVGTGLFGTDMA
jgi:hypothetical protein